MNKLGGIIIPAVTPFDRDGTLRLDLLRKNYEKWNSTAVQGYMCLGSNGEFRLLDDAESLQVILAASEAADPEKCLIAGIGRESLHHTLSFLHALEDAAPRIDYVSVLMPGYFKALMTDEALIAYFTAIADASPWPVLLYCAPGFTNGVCISPEALKILADHPNLHGIKDTSKDMMDTYMDAVGGRSDFEVLAGSMNTILKCMDRGGKGGVVSASNYFPDECAEVVRLYREKGPDAAREYYAELKALIARTGGRGSVATVKACMNLLGYSGGSPRSPILAAKEDVVAEIRSALKEAGKI